MQLSTQQARTAGGKLYVAEELVKQPTYCIEGVAPDVIGGGFLPRRLLVNKELFIHRLGNFYTREKLSEEMVVSFFDIVAPRYDSLIEREPNTDVIKRVFERIKVTYGLKRAVKPRLRKKHLPLLANEQKNILEPRPPSFPFVSTSDKQSTIKILDWGTGTGLSYQIYKAKKGLFKKYSILKGCDISEGMLKQCREKNSGYEVFKCRYASSPFRDCFFDVVFAIFVSPYIIDEKPYREVFRVLKHGGLLIFNLTSSEYNENSTRLTHTLREVGFRGINFEIWKIKKPETTRYIPMVFAKKA